MTGTTYLTVARGNRLRRVYRLCRHPSPAPAGEGSGEGAARYHSRMWTASFDLRTGDRPVALDLTARVNEAIRQLGDGMLLVFLPHATAGLALIELGAGSGEDLLDRLQALLPSDAPYRHRHGAPGHGRDHLLPALISPSITLPVAGGRLDLGTWQSLVLIDTNVDNPVRTVRLSFIAG